MQQDVTGITAESVKNFVEQNPKLVKRTRSLQFPDLYVLKYSKRVFYDNLWNPTLEELRGAVVDENYVPVAMPFKKIYNRNERGTNLPPNQLVTAVRKVNGFMAAVSDYNGKQLISTTGSVDSDWVKMAHEFLQNIQPIKGYTLLFEIVHPNDNPHPIREQQGAYLIGAREVRWGGEEIKHEQAKLDAIASDYQGLLRPEWLVSEFIDICKHVKQVKHEGFVIHDKSTPLSLKIKSPFYLTKKFVSRMNPKRFEEFCSNPSHFKKQTDEEFWPLIDAVIADKEEFSKLSETDKYVYVERFFKNA